MSMKRTCPISNFGSEASSADIGLMAKVLPASTRRTSSFGSRISLPIQHFSRIDSGSTQKIGEARIRAEWPKLGGDILYRRVLFETFLQPAKRFIFFAKSDVDARDRIRCNIFRRGNFFQLIED